MSQLTTPPVQLSMDSYWQLVDADEDRTATAAVHKYNPTTNSWDHISNMTNASQCLPTLMKLTLLALPYESKTRLPLMCVYVQDIVIL